MKLIFLFFFVVGLFSCAPMPAPPSSTVANKVLKTIPAEFHGSHPVGPHSFTISATAIIENSHPCRVTKVEILAPGKVCRVTAVYQTHGNSRYGLPLADLIPEGNNGLMKAVDVCILRLASDGMVIIESRALKEAHARWEREGGDYPD